MQKKSNCYFRDFKTVVSRMNNLLQIIQLNWNFVLWGEKKKLFKFVSRHAKENKVYSQAVFIKKLIKASYIGSAVTGGILTST